MYVETILRTKGRNVATIPPGETVAGTASRMEQEKIGALVVSDDGVTVLGIISERDIARAVARHGDGLGAMRVEQLMTRNVVTCAPADSIAEIMSVMTERRFRHLPVVEGGVMCGLISIGDVVKIRLEEVEQEAVALREYISGG